MSTASAEAGVDGLTVEVVWCERPAMASRVVLKLPAGSSLGQALERSGLVNTDQLLKRGLKVGIWGRTRSLDTPLRDMDRVEVYRALKVDPKEARRLRYRRHKSG
jgi:putative ubiquitin-RnfH superfamily antitoxin RatB of RatAB toxin-antitoxin module